jgi:hypothetical protein
LRDIEYAPQTQDLIVCFKSLVAYQYTGVPPEIVKGLCAAESKGAYFHTHIRNAFPYKKLPDYVPFDWEAARAAQEAQRAQEAAAAEALSKNPA